MTDEHTPNYIKGEGQILFALDKKGYLLKAYATTNKDEPLNPKKFNFDNLLYAKWLVNGAFYILYRYPVFQQPKSVEESIPKDLNEVIEQINAISSEYTLDYLFYTNLHLRTCQPRQYADRYVKI